MTVEERLPGTTTLFAARSPTPCRSSGHSGTSTPTETFPVGHAALQTAARANSARLPKRFVSDSSEACRELLTHMRSRGAAVEVLIRQEFAINPDARIILFHESIEEVEQLFMRLFSLGFAVIAEAQRELPNAMRRGGA